MKKILLVFLMPFFVSSCAKISESNLYWGGYSETLYAVKKNPGEETNQEHEQQLLSIVEKSKELNLRVPPGVYAELGIYAMKRGDKAVGKKYFDLELKTYPESSTVLQRANLLFE